MIRMKIHVEIPLGAQDFIPYEYIPGDVVNYLYDPEWMDMDRFFELIKKDIKEVWNERQKTGKEEKRQKDLQKSSRSNKKNKH